MTITVLAFARVRELVGFSERALELPEGSSVDDARALLEAEAPGGESLWPVTRCARNGAIARGDDVLEQGDELALLPPVGGG